MNHYHDGDGIHLLGPTDDRDDRDAYWTAVNGAFTKAYHALQEIDVRQESGEITLEAAVAEKDSALKFYVRTVQEQRDRYHLGGIR
jgi:hypothetical protein